MNTALHNALGSAAAVALGATLLFFLFSKTWVSATRVWRRRSHFGEQILYEAGHRMRKRLHELDRYYSVHLASALVFLVLFATALVLRPAGWLPAVSVWTLAPLLAVVAAAVGYAGYQLFKLFRARRDLAYQRDAYIGIGHALQRLSDKGNRIFYEVPCGNAVIDNVVVGPQGVYAVNVVLPAGPRGGEARLQDKRLIFEPHGEACCIRDCQRRVEALTAELRQVLGHPVRVRSVIAVPGCSLASPSTDELLLVNERNVTMLTGWKDKRAYLMDEEVERVQAHLAQRCLNSHAELH